MPERVLTQTFCAASAILEKDGKILLVKENWDSPDKGKWNQPGGWVDVGENPIVSVIKEVKEETGLDFEPTRLLGIYSLVREDLKSEKGTPHPFKLVFLGKFSGEGHLENTKEISELKWFDPAEIENMTPDTLRDIDIKKEVQDYFTGRSFPLDIIRHTIQK